MSGPRSLTLRNKKRVVKFKASGDEKKAISVDIAHAIWPEGIGEPVVADLTDAEVRKLKNWLTWYLDNK